MDITATNSVMQVLISSIAQPDGQVAYSEAQHDAQLVAEREATDREIEEIISPAPDVFALSTLFRSL